MVVDFGALVHGPGLKALGEAFTYQPQAGGAFTITADFSHPPLDVEIGGEVTWSTGAPALGIRAADLPDGFWPANGDEITRLKDGAVYRVANVQPDGHGWITLPLHKV